MTSSVRITTGPESLGSPPSRATHTARCNFPLWIALILLLVLVLLATVGVALSAYDPNAIGAARFVSPSWSHLLGTDNLGRDTFTRTIVAARSDLSVSFLATLIAMFVGTTAGLLAGYHGGWIDNLIMRATDVALSIPAILFALLVGVTFGSAVWILVITLGLIFSPVFARVMRAPALVLKQREFVMAARLSGLTNGRIIVRHLLPNALGPLLVQFGNTASIVIMLEASLGYLGQGVQPPDASSGRMVSDAQPFLALDPMMMVAPILLIVVMTFSWNLLADGVQRWLANRH
ncbi:ABC transporter permease [Leekyejoonella antrihumi]|uniref:ABC transporter permease n=2 Tax=Leekyejoonella antrihumi TaxID=1660198 RepID=A0A563DYW6_9MICO|nr:ABC transporter permease [Leekyejoonella antrihumi]